jgi:membrane protease YdiL (CAAX protease family)
VREAVAQFRKFLGEEKVYGYLLAGILLIYALLLASSPPGEERMGSDALERIKQAEKAVKKEGGEMALVEQAFRENPGMAIALALVMGFFVTGILAGLVLEGIFIMRQWTRRPSIERVRPEEPVAWGLADVAKVTILFFSASLAANFALSFLKGFAFKGWTENFMILVHTTVSDFFIVGALLYFVMRKHGHGIEAIGLHFKTWLRDVGLGLIGYLATLPLFLGVLLGLVALSAVFSYEPAPHPLVEVFVEEDKRSPMLIGYSVFLACVIGPFIEEIFFRGFCYPAMKKRWGKGMAMMATAALFAWVHQSMFAFLPIFVLGMVLAYLYEERGSLIPSIAMHITHNSIFIGYFFIVKRLYLDRLLAFAG